jgi:two-component system phosphate regulon sensor histidine kinase PhoR
VIEKRYPDGIATGAVDASAKEFAKSLRARITIIDHQGRVWGDSDVLSKDLSSLENHRNRPEVQQALEKGNGESIRYSSTLSTSMFYVASSLSLGGKTSGVVRLALSLSEVDRTTSRAYQFIYLATLVSLIGAVMLTILTSAWISKPIRELARTARKMASGELTVKTKKQTSDELEELANSLNFLSAELKEKINKLSREKSQLQAILSGMLEGLMVTDEKGKVVLINKSLEDIFSIEDSAIGKTPLELVRRGELQEAINKVLKDNLPLTIRFPLFLPEVKELEVNLVSFEFEDRRRGIVAVFHDITKLGMLERVRKDFVANVSHELRTPLTAIKGYTETLLEGEIQDLSQIHEFLTVIANHAERLSLIVQDLLSLSRIESADFTPSLQPVSLKRVGERVIGTVGEMARKKSISLTLNIPEVIPEIPADELLLEQALLNLLDNAIKYNREGGTVSLSAMLKDSEVEVKVTDTGIGIGSEHLPRIFERFYRVDKGRSREMGGTGLGLSIVKNIIEKHGGKVWAESELNEGSTFFFTIPRA